MFLAEKMETKLKINDHKVHWSSCSFEYLFNRLKEETNELLSELARNDLSDVKNLSDEAREAIVLECADIANFAAMIAENISNKNGVKNDKRI